MAYLLQPLLRIRAMREDRAAGELTAAKQAVSVAHDALEARKLELDDYLRTKEERRDRIYESIIGHAVTRDQIDMANEGIARIDEEGVLKEDNVKRADAELKKREEAEAAARAAFSLATKNRMKIDEHKAVWQAEDAAEQERLAETELEDFMVRKLEI